MTHAKIAEFKSDLRNTEKNRATKESKRDQRKETIAVFVEEAEGLLELGDLFVGELIGHLGGGCLGS